MWRVCVREIEMIDCLRLVTFSFTYFIFEKRKKGEWRVCVREIEMIDCLRLVTFSFTYFNFEKKKKERRMRVQKVL